MTYLLVNADDFGYARDVNAGIVEAYRNGILRSTTLMATGGAFKDAVRLAAENPGLDIGCHLVLIEGMDLPRTHAEMIRAVATRRVDPYAVFKTQIERILAAGIKPTHLDTHKHAHLFPPVLKAVACLADEFDIRWVRRPFDLPLEYHTTREKSLFMRFAGLMKPYFDSVLRRNGCLATDHFFGYAITGRFSVASISSLLKSLPEGSVEFMCHPGHCTSELRSMQTRLKESRAQELAVLTSPEIREAISRADIKLVNYQELCALTSSSPSS